MWLGRSQQKSTTSSDFDVNKWSDTAALVAKATAAGFNGYATAAEPSAGVGAVCAVRVVRVIDFVGVLGVVGVIDVAVIILRHSIQYGFLLLKSRSQV